MTHSTCVIALPSNPQEVPGSPVLQSLHSSPSVFRDEAGTEISLHENPPTTSLSCPGKELILSGNLKCDRFTSPIGRQSPLPPASSELDPSLRHLLGGSVSPAVGSSTPSPTPYPTAGGNATSNLPVPAVSHIHQDGEQLIGSVGSAEALAAANLGIQSGVGLEGADSHSEVVRTCACTYMCPTATQTYAA